MTTLEQRRERMLTHKRRELDSLPQRNINYDATKSAEHTEKFGWNVDHYDVELPSEAPGAPLLNGAWAAAQSVMLNYEFPDPNIVTGIFLSDTPLAQRVMLLEGRFLLFRFYFGVKISRVIDEVRGEGADKLHVWGYSYRTLEGHWEMGEITFLLIKHAATGALSFHIDAYSKTGHIPNPIYRMGFRVFGRNLQIKFAQRCLDRMVMLTEAKLANRDADIETPEVAPLPSTLSDEIQK